MIPGLGRSAGEGIGYPLQYSCASLVAQLVKNPPAMQETWVRSLGWEDLLEKGEATHSSILPGESPWTEEPGGLQSMGHRGVGYNSATTQQRVMPLRMFMCRLLSVHLVKLGFPGSSHSKESACNAGDLGPIPGLGRCPGGGHGNPL